MLMEKVVDESVAMLTAYPDAIAEILGIDLKDGGVKADKAGRAVRLCVTVMSMGHKKLTNPAVPFAEKAKAGEFDKLTDEEYENRLEQVEAVTPFWQGCKELSQRSLLNSILSYAEPEFLAGRQQQCEGEA